MGLRRDKSFKRLLFVRSRLGFNHGACAFEKHVSEVRACRVRSWPASEWASACVGVPACALCVLRVHNVHTHVLCAQCVHVCGCVCTCVLYVHCVYVCVPAYMCRVCTVHVHVDVCCTCTYRMRVCTCVCLHTVLLASEALLACAGSLERWSSSPPCTWSSFHSEVGLGQRRSRVPGEGPGIGWLYPCSGGLCCQYSLARASQPLHGGS